MESKRSALSANNNSKPPKVKKKKKKFVSEDEDFGPWFSRPSIKLSFKAKKPFQEVLRRTRYQSDGPRVHYLTTAGHTLPIDLIKAMEKAGVLIKKVNAGSDDYDTQLDLELAERCIDTIAGFRKCTRDLPSDWKYDRATAILFAP